MSPRKDSRAAGLSAYRGRFAPSPTGPLHFGSLVAAVAGFLEARTRGGVWLVRIEDIDPPREIQGAADAILKALDAYGLNWDERVLYQSRRADAYEAALQVLRANNLIYGCTCSRREIAATRSPNRGPEYYPGTCRGGLPEGDRGRALRVLTETEPVTFHDTVQGPQRQDLETEVGDFVLRRADGLWAYQLAVVVDDAAQGITDVVRGADLLDSTPRQIYLQRLLGVPTPTYMHVPTALNAAGEKLSKQTGAPPLDPDKPVPTLWAALDFLGQAPPKDLRRASRDEIWSWALARWSCAAVPQCVTLHTVGGSAPD